jgi:hypothetical protein
LISSTCKKEGVDDQRDLIRTIVAAIESAPKDNPNVRLWSVATDGDPTRRPIFHQLFTTRELEPQSTLREILGELQLFDYRCGESNVTNDCDYKHVIKRFRSMLLRVRGVSIDGVMVNEATMKVNFQMNTAPASLHSLLNPNDRQDVPLAFGLLSCFRNLREERESDSVPLKASRRIFRLLGHLYGDLLEPYSNVALSLSEQLSHLSSLAHLMMALYSLYKGSLCSVQLYYDTMAMIKTAYFSVAKMKEADSDGCFWLMQLGTDALEKLFGIVRTMIGSDTNCDILQLNERLASASMVSEIFNRHPDWSKGPRRLRIESSVREISEKGVVSHKVDHINARSWIGDVHVRSVNLKSCWNRGRESATKALNAAGIMIDFGVMVKAGLSIFSPLLSDPGYVVGIGRCQGEESDEATEVLLQGGVDDSQSINRRNQPLVNPQSLAGAEDLASDTPSATPDIDDLAIQQAEASKYQAFISIDPKNPDGKKQHKSTILRILCMDRGTFALSTDRLRRVCGFTRHLYTPWDNLNAVNLEDPLTQWSKQLQILDPIIIVVKLKGSGNSLFVAVAQVISMKCGTNLIDSLASGHIRDKDILVDVEILELARMDASESPTGSWFWTGRRETRSSYHIRSYPTALLQPFDPATIQAPGHLSIKTTYLIEGEELITLGLQTLLDGKEDLANIPEVISSPTFPLRSSTG